MSELESRMDLRFCSSGSLGQHPTPPGNPLHLQHFFPNTLVLAIVLSRGSVKIEFNSRVYVLS